MSDQPTRPPVLSLAAIEAELARRRFVADPVAWAGARLGDELWSGQRELLNAVRDNRKTAAMTCHGVGKSFSAGVVVGWWLDTHKPGTAFVVTTAPSNPQVRVILWKEIGRVHIRGHLYGRTNQTEWIMNINGKDEIVGMGRKPNDYSPDAFQGIHAPHVLVIIDEANGVRGPLWDALDSLTANDTSKTLLLGNPDDPTGEFYDSCKPGSGYAVVQIGAFDTPNFTGEYVPPAVAQQLIGYRYVEERRAKWAPAWTWTADKSRVVMPAGAKLEDTHPFWQSKVLGRFPIQSSAGSLIPLSWIRDAQERTLPPIGECELGLDVGASVDGDPSCLGHRRGPVFRVLYEERQPDTMKTAGKAIAHLHDLTLGATVLKVDYTGVGRGVVDRGREQGLPVIGIQVGEACIEQTCLKCHSTWSRLESDKQCPNCGSKAFRGTYANLLSELWWAVRTRFEGGDIDLAPADEQLAEELLTLRWAPNSRGQIQVQYAKGPSPNRADALLISFAPVHTVKEDWATW